MKNHSNTLTRIIYTRAEFGQLFSENFAYFMERVSKIIRPILQDENRVSSHVACEKHVLRLSFELTEDFIEYCPSQLPCRPALLLDSLCFEHFGETTE